MEDFEKIEWFHTMDINGYTTKGLCDWRPYKKYFFLEKSKNQTVLDIGAGDGFFSFEMEKLGAKVVATEIESQFERDNYKFGIENLKSKHSLTKGYSFNLVKKHLKSDVKLITSNIYNLDKDLDSKFDIIFCSDVIMHLTDPVKAITKICDVSKKYIIIGNPINHISLRGKGFISAIKNLPKYLALKLLNNDPFILFQGHTNRNIFWLPSFQGIVSMLRSCGFELVDYNIFNTSSKHHVSPQRRVVILAEKIKK
tara:strand:+ start:54 stop:815 length:762 start_codon:yes stop_codon:yes gene_type:complete